MAGSSTSVTLPAPGGVGDVCGALGASSEAQRLCVHVSGLLSKLRRPAETKQAACCTLRCLFAELGAVLPRLAPLPTGFRFQAI